MELTHNRRWANTYIDKYLPTDWEVLWHHEEGLETGPGADMSTKVLHLPEVDEITLMGITQPISTVVLHELGHAVCDHAAPVRLQDHYLVTCQEIEAWAWARHHWAEDMEVIDNSAALALYTYRLPAVLGAKRMPPMPEWEKEGFVRIMAHYIQSL